MGFSSRLANANTEPISHGSLPSSSSKFLQRPLAHLMEPFRNGEDGEGHGHFPYPKALLKAPLLIPSIYTRIRSLKCYSCSVLLPCFIFRGRCLPSNSNVRKASGISRIVLFPTFTRSGSRFNGRPPAGEHIRVVLISQEVSHAPD